MWPMLLGIGPLLGDGEVGGSVNSDGERESWSYQDGRVALKNSDGKTLMEMRLPGKPYVQATAPSVAVLIDERTASSGEAIAVAFKNRPLTRFFGRHTAGISTANHGFVLSDGAHLILTVAADVDRKGRSYESGVDVDVETPVGNVGDIDPAIEAGVKWILASRAH